MRERFKKLEMTAETLLLLKQELKFKKSCAARKAKTGPDAAITAGLIDGYTDDRSLGYSISSIWDCEPTKNCPACRISPAFFKISGVQSDVSIRTKSSDRPFTSVHAS